MIPFYNPRHLSLRLDRWIVFDTVEFVRVKPFPRSGTGTPTVEASHVKRAARMFNVCAKSAKNGYGMPLAMEGSVRWKKDSR